MTLNRMGQGLGACSLAVILVIGLSGCLNKQVSEKIEGDVPATIAGTKLAQQPAAAVSYDPLEVTDQIWAGQQSVRLRRGFPLPATVEGSRGVTLVSAQPMNLTEVAGFISNQTGIPVRLSDGAESLGGAGGAAAVAGLAATPAGGSSGRPAVAGGAATPAAGGGADIKPMTLAYEGPLSGLLDNLAGHFGVSWRYDGNSINMSRYETRTFVVEALQGTTDINDGMQGDSGASGGGGSGGSGGLEQSSKTSLKIDYWAELKETITTLLGGVGEVKISPSSGTITVITTPEIMRSVAQHMADENRRSTRQVAITVELFTLTITESENFSTKLTTLYNDLEAGRFGLTGVALPAISSDTGGQLSAGVLSPTSKFNGSEALVQALGSLGNVSRVARIPMTTLNNRPASRRIGRDKAYLASVSVSQSGDSNFQQASLTPGTVREGFSLQVTPRILGDGRILIQYSLSVIELLKDPIEQISVGDNSLQLPETSSRVFVQQALLNNNDMLVLSGFDQDSQLANNEGLGNPYNWLMGGKSTASKTRELFFLTMTPREIDVPRRASLMP